RFATADLPALESLTLDECILGEAGLRAVTHSPGLSGLRRLCLAGHRNEIGPEGYWTIASSSATLPNLETLLLDAQRGGAEGLRALAAWPGLKGLTRLDLSFNYTDHDEDEDYTDALADFASSRRWGELRELDLDGDTVSTPAELDALLSASN